MMKKLFLQEQDYYNIPDWKKKFVNNNRKLYLENKEFIDQWIVKYHMLDRIKLLSKIRMELRNRCYRYS